MHYLVTGGCGFIGGHLTRALLARGHQVTVLDDLSTGKRENLAPGATLVEGSILDQELVASLLLNKVDGCFHLAAIPSVERCFNEWAATSEINVLGTVAIFEACRKHPSGPVPVVYASSAAVYGPYDAPVSEDHMLPKPTSSYGVDKLSCELYGQIAWSNYGLRNVGLRFFNVYGPGQPKGSPYSGVITCFMHAFENDQPITIFGDGQQSRDFIFVGDIAEACMAAMEHEAKQSEIYNVCTGVRASILDIATTMAEVYGKPLSVEHKDARTGDIRHSLGVPDKLRGAMKHLPTPITLREGLSKTVII